MNAFKIVHYQQTPEFWEAKTAQMFREANALRKHLLEHSLPTQGSGLDYWTRRAEHCAAEARRLRDAPGQLLNITA